MSSMDMRGRKGEQGSSSLLVPLVIVVFVLLVSLVFGGWSFAQMLDYKNNVDAKISAAVAAALKTEDQKKDATFAEQQKNPLVTYSGPSAYGSIKVQYPKTWSAYIADTGTGSPYVDGYFYPGAVPSTADSSSVYALRVQILDQSYSTVLSQFNALVKQGGTTVAPYQAPKVKSVIGSRINGKLNSTVSGSMILLPLRNTTLKIWTEAPQFEQDFDTNVLPNLTFLP